MPRVDIITMGCSKNLVDSERLIRRLEAKGYTAYHNDENPSGDYVVVNTCGFIGDAKEESVNMILNLGVLKKKGKIGKLMVMGCLSERYREELAKEIPEVDVWYGKFDWTKFIDSIPDNSKQNAKQNPTLLKEWERSLTTPPWSAYIKVSEGCDRYCAYCAIPHITGRHTSRPIDEILDEVRDLVKKGVKEFNVIAQDLSSYGLDLYNEHKLPELIDRMAEVEGVEWIRLHYLYPTDFPMGILDVMNRHENVCKYIDIALQHISDKVLEGMNRKITAKDTIELLDEIRKRVPGIHIRTTVMTGFPGEGEEEFEELMEFVRSQKFERLGGFAYSEEEDTLAAKTLEDNIPQDIKEDRISQVMALQQEISLDSNTSKVGKTLKVLVESYEGDLAVGRTEFDSPEVDHDVFITGCKVQPGNFVNVRIQKAGPFELYGTVETN